MLLPCGGADGWWSGKREVVPLPPPLLFGHRAVSVLRRITVTLSFLLPHFRRTPHSALVPLAVRVTKTHTHRENERESAKRERERDIHRQLPRHSHIWLMASCDLSDPFLPVYCGPTWPGLSGQRCRPRPLVSISVSVSVLTVLVVAPNGKLVRQGRGSRGDRRRDVRRKCGKKCAFIF